MFVICEFNSDLQELFRESLELVWKNAHQVLWHYLKIFKSYGEFILSDGFSVFIQCVFILQRQGQLPNGKPMSDPKTLFTEPKFQTTKIMKQSFIMSWQKHHLIRDMVTTKGLSYMSNTKMALNCRNISGILQVLIKFQPSNGALSEKYTETQNQISVSSV